MTREADCPLSHTLVEALRTTITTFTEHHSGLTWADIVHACHCVTDLMEQEFSDACAAQGWNHDILSDP